MRIIRRHKYVGSGARDRWVTIESRPPDDGSSDSGFPVDAPWSPLATVAMYREEAEGKEVDRGGTWIATNLVRWEMPYREDMDPERHDVQAFRRLTYLGRIYEIISAAPLENRKRGIELYTEVGSETPSQ